MKIFSPYPPEVNNALKENLAHAEFIANSIAADISLPKLLLPLRLGELLDFIESCSANIISADSLKIDLAKNTIEHLGKTISITEKEAAIISYLAKAKTLITREVMIKEIWGYAESADSKTVENHIYRLRAKVEAAFKKEIIITDGSGYKLIN